MPRGFGHVEQMYVVLCECSLRFELGADGWEDPMHGFMYLRASFVFIGSCIFILLLLYVKYIISVLFG